MDSKKLELLANNICDNCRDSTPRKHQAKVVEHLRMFWAPLMISQLEQANREGKVKLNPVLIAALQELAGK